MRLTCTVVIAILLAVSTAPVFAQTQQRPMELPNPFQALFRGTPQEQAACEPDANKFCKAAGNDDFRVLRCLQQNRQQISTPCRRVLESHGQ